MINFKFDKLKVNILIIMLLAFPVFKPDSLRHVIPVLDTVYDGCRIIGFVVIVLLFLYRKKKVSAVTIFIMLVELWRVISTLVNKGHVSMVVINALSTLLLLFIFECFSEDMPSLIKGFLIIFELLIYACFISILLYFPRGMYTLAHTTTTQYYLLGNRNSIIFFVMPAILLSLINLQMGGSRIRSLVLIVVSYLSIFTVWSITSLISVTTLICLILFGKSEIIAKVNIFFTFVVAFILNILIVNIRIQERIPSIADFIEEHFGKTFTLSGRSFIWDQAFLLIKSHLILGLGEGNHIEYRNRYFSGHNQVINLLIIGGIPLLILFIWLTVIVLKKIQMYASNARLYKVFYSIFVCMFIDFFAEGRLSNDLYILFCLAYNIDLIDNSCITDETGMTSKVRVRLHRKKIRELG